MRYKKSITLWTVLFSFVLSCPSLPAIDKEPLIIVKDGKYGYIDHSSKVKTEMAISDVYPVL